MARDLRGNSCGEADTVHAVLFAIKNDRMAWDRRIVVVADKAAMLDSRVMGKVLAEPNLPAGAVTTPSIAPEQRPKLDRVADLTADMEPASEPGQPRPTRSRKRAAGQHQEMRRVEAVISPLLWVSGCRSGVASRRLRIPKRRQTKHPPVLPGELRHALVADRERRPAY